MRALGLYGCLLSFFLGCATSGRSENSAPDPSAWINVGVTSRDEVIARYGTPDLSTEAPDGAWVIYGPAAAQKPLSIEIPTMTPGPSGSIVTHSHIIEPGLGSVPDERKRLSRQLKIRYDARGIVQEMTQ